MKLLVVVICGFLLITACARQEAQDKAETPVVAVQVAKAELADIPQAVSAPGVIFPQQQANIAARITAPIRELRVRKGSSVQQGQVVAILENRDLTAQKQQADAALADAKANLDKTTNGTLPTDIERANGEAETTRAALDQAQKDFDRRHQLFAQGAIPQRDLLVSETALATAKVNYNVAQRSLDLLKNRSGKLDVQIAKARVEQAEASLAVSSANLNFSELRAPFTGTITEQFQYPGDMANPNSPIYTLMDLSTVVVHAQVPESEAAAIETKQDCGFTAADAKQVDSGRVTVVNRAVDPARRTLEVWCEIPHPPLRLRAGVFGAIRIKTGHIPSVVVVPIPAVQVQEGTQKGFVLVVDGHNIAHQRSVQVGDAFEGKFPVTQGLRPGELVVTVGAYGTPDGTAVRIASAQRENDR